MPGAQLTEVVDKNTYKGNIAVRLGPVALTFAGTVRFEALDDDARTARGRAGGSDAKGRGGAHAGAAVRPATAGGGAPGVGPTPPAPWRGRGGNTGGGSA